MTRQQYGYKNSKAADFCQPILWQCPDIPINLRWDTTRHSCPAMLHYHNKALEIHIVRKCDSHFLINRKKRQVSGHMALIIPPLWKHRNLHDFVKSIHQITLMLEPATILKRNIRSSFAALPESIQLTNFELGIIEIQCRLIKHEILNPSSNSLTIVRNEMENMFFLLQRAAAKRTPEPVSDARIVRAVDLIEKRYNQNLTIKQISTSVAMSPSHLSHVFKSQTGTSIKQYILERRIEASKVLLESDKCPKLAHLSELVGFSDLSSFSRYFKNHVGVSPAAYRNISHK